MEAQENPRFIEFERGSRAGQALWAPKFKMSAHFALASAREILMGSRSSAEAFPVVAANFAKVMVLFF